jgi:thiol-disulfide isomerase/thioredoxin
MLLELGAPAPDFNLPEPATGKTVTLADCRGALGLLVMFICNHCPYVKHIRAGLAAFARDYLPKGLKIIAINANDVAHFPDDSQARMVAEVNAAGYSFPYLYDATQAVAKAYRAACTPDIYLFDADLKLVYRGQFDGSRPGNNVPVTGADLRAAVDALLGGQLVATDQKPSMGCNIKWQPGNEPDYCR